MDICVSNTFAFVRKLCKQSIRSFLCAAAADADVDVDVPGARLDDALVVAVRALAPDAADDMTDPSRRCVLASSFSYTPGSRAQVHFQETFRPPSAEKVTEMSPTEGDAHISEIGRALREACEKARCDHVGLLWVAMPRSSLQDLFKLLLKLSELT
jgi:hypothetical protein